MPTQYCEEKISWVKASHENSILTRWAWTGEVDLDWRVHTLNTIIIINFVGTNFYEFYFHGQCCLCTNYYPVSTCSVDTHNANMFYSSVTLTNYCGTLMVVNNLMLQQTTAKFHDNILSLYDTQTWWDHKFSWYQSMIVVFLKPLQ